MNVALHRELEFFAGFYIPAFPDRTLQSNRYRVSVYFVTTTDDFYEVNVAMDRVRVMIDREFSQSVFVCDRHRDAAVALKDLGADITLLPEEPLDQVIGIMLYCKLTAVMEQRMEITQLDLASDAGDNVWYQHYQDDAQGPFAADGWWNQPGPGRGSVMLEQPQIVPAGAGSWEPYGLTWASTAAAPTATVVYGKFGSDES